MSVVFRETAVHCNAEIYVLSNGGFFSQHARAYGLVHIEKRFYWSMRISLVMLANGTNFMRAP